MADDDNKPKDAPPPYTEPAGGNPPYPTNQPPYPAGAAAAPYPTGGYPPSGGYPPAGYPPTGNYPPRADAYAQPYGAYPAAYSTTNTTVVRGGQPTTTVVVTGRGCSTCGNGYLVEQFTCCGILMAILFFPLGIICCLAMRIRVCSNCGTAYG